MHVLLVTGSARVTEQALTALEDEDRVTCDEVWTPERALALLDEEGYACDLVLADNDTAPTGGFYLARELKARVRMGRSMPPVVLLVAREQDDYLARWAEADAWVLKPVDSFDLAEVVNALVERRPVPELPGVRSFAQLGAIKGPGQAGALPHPDVPEVSEVAHAPESVDEP